MEPIRIPDPSEREFDEIPLLKAGEYRARLISVEERPNNYDPDSPQWLWFWRLTEPGFEDHPVWQYTSQKLGAFEDKQTHQVKRSAARVNLEALMGAELQPGTELDWESQVYGCEAILSLVRIQNKSGEWRNKVVAVFGLETAVSAGVKKKPADAAPTTSSPEPAARTVLPEELGYTRRYEIARAALGWPPEQVRDTIEWICEMSKPFHLLPTDKQAAVVAFLEEEAQKADVPFYSPETAAEDTRDDADRELDEAGLTPPEPEVNKRPLPASAKHRVA